MEVNSHKRYLKCVTSNNNYGGDGDCGDDGDNTGMVTAIDDELVVLVTTSSINKQP